MTQHEKGDSLAEGYVSNCGTLPVLV
ncbi:hypothetical protein Gohar_021158 [Gossypium harknessii]|uniref:Uncharacterized protein n=1 Tax=Gossypium harknessii TaxID=34285 RepID=A0A7J9IBA0_9ROSI|nr:hypothetical protein [Gossypium harknessii]